MGAKGLPGAGFGYNPWGGGWDRFQGAVLFIFSSELLLFSSTGVQGLDEHHVDQWVSHCCTPTHPLHPVDPPRPMAHPISVGPWATESKNRLGKRALTWLCLLRQTPVATTPRADAGAVPMGCSRSACPSIPSGQDKAELSPTSDKIQDSIPSRRKGDFPCV